MRRSRAGPPLASWSFPQWRSAVNLLPHCGFAPAEKDVNRTDRTNRFYEGMDNPGLVLLHDILMTYCMYDFDLGERQSSDGPPADHAGPSH